MKILPELFRKNKEWAHRITETNPGFFEKLVHQQSPEYLWIGCADSRVPANEIVGLLPGEMFVHRNIANLVVHSDMNCLSVIHYAVEVLKIRHIIVCGHYDCSGVKTAIEGRIHGLCDNWLGHIRDIYRKHEDELLQITSVEERTDRLCEINVVEQVVNVGGTATVQEAWAKGQNVSIHGWIYHISNGILRDLDVCVSSSDELRSLERRNFATPDWASAIKKAV
jgi:carbonic anhydrase